MGNRAAAAGPGLDDAIERLYRVFGAYRLRPWTEPCMHCHTIDDERVLHREPLQRLSPEDLAGFAGDSLMTWGEVVDFKHFLPRIFEILATTGFPGGYPNTETIVGGLSRGDWRTWPSQEQVAVDAFLTALWHGHLARFPAIHETDTVLASIALVVDDVAPYLEVWLAMDGTAPVVHFAEFLRDNPAATEQRQEALSNPWLRDRPHQEAQIRQWLHDIMYQFVPRIETAFVELTNDQALSLLAPALERIGY